MLQLYLRESRLQSQVVLQAVDSKQVRPPRLLISRGLFVYLIEYDKLEVCSGATVSCLGCYQHSLASPQYVRNKKSMYPVSLQLLRSLPSSGSAVHQS